MNEEADGKHVVIVNGQRASGLLTEEEANAEAAKRRAAIQEKAGDTGKKATVEVKRNILG